MHNIIIYNEWVNGFNDWTNKGTNGRMKEQMNEPTNEWVSEWVRNLTLPSSEQLAT